MIINETYISIILQTAHSVNDGIENRIHKDQNSTKSFVEKVFAIMAAFRTPAYGRTGTTPSSPNAVSSPLNQSKELNLESVPIIKDPVIKKKPMPISLEIGFRDETAKNGSIQSIPSVFVTPPSSPNLSASQRKHITSKGEPSKTSVPNEKSKSQLEPVPTMQSRSKSLDHQTHDSLDLNDVEVIDDVSINRWLMRIMRLGASYTSTGSNGYNNTTNQTITESSNTATNSPSTSPSSYSSSYMSPPTFGASGALMTSSFLHQGGRRRMSLNVLDQNHLSRLPTATGWRARRLSESSSLSSGGPGIPIPSSNQCNSGYMSSPAATARANRLRRGIIFRLITSCINKVHLWNCAIDVFAQLCSI